MFDNSAIKGAFGRSAAQYDEHAQLQRVVRQHATSIALQYWPKSGLILDAGCGTGVFAAELKAQRPGLSVIGFDIAAGMCAHSRAICVNADAAHIPFAPSSFDGVFSSLMLQWVSDTKAVFAELYQLLKPGTVAIITTLTEGTLHELKSAFAAVDSYPHVSDFHVPHTLIECAERAGFSLAVAKQDKIVEYYPDTIALMRALQVIGASNKHAARNRGLMTPKKFAGLEREYAARFMQPRGLPVSWQVLTLALRKDGDE